MIEEQMMKRSRGTSACLLRVVMETHATQAKKKEALKIWDNGKEKKRRGQEDMEYREETE